MSNQPIIVITVQGTRFFSNDTIAPEKTWYSTGGRIEGVLSENLRFRAGDEASPAVIVREFHWTGANDERARRAASESLANILGHWRDARSTLKLAEGVQFDKQPSDAGREFVILAHSHGGNIVLDALQKCSADNRSIEDLRQVLLIGTPLLVKCSNWFVDRISLPNFLGRRLKRIPMLITNGALISGLLIFAATLYRTQFSFYDVVKIITGDWSMLVNNGSYTLWAIVFVLAAVLYLSVGLINEWLRRRNEAAISETINSEERLFFINHPRDEAVNGLRNLGLNSDYLARSAGRELEGPVQSALQLFAVVEAQRHISNVNENVEWASRWQLILLLLTTGAAVTAGMLGLRGVDHDGADSIRALFDGGAIAQTFAILQSTWLRYSVPFLPLIFLAGVAVAHRFRGRPLADDIEDSVKYFVHQYAYGFIDDPSKFKAIGITDGKRTVRTPAMVEFSIDQTMFRRHNLNLEPPETLLNVFAEWNEGQIAEDEGETRFRNALDKAYAGNPLFVQTGLKTASGASNKLANLLASRNRKIRASEIVRTIKEEIIQDLQNQPLRHSTYFDSPAFLLWIARLVSDAFGGRLTLVNGYDARFRQAIEDAFPGSLSRRQADESVSIAPSVSMASNPSVGRPKLNKEAV